MNHETHPIAIPVSDVVAPVEPKSTVMRSSVAAPVHRQAGLLIINADDWGRDRETTDRTLECKVRGSISSVSAMVFMADSERAAVISRERGIDAGLHLNFTTPFSAPDCPARLRERQNEIARCLLRYRFSQSLFHPTLAQLFRYVISAQLDEFCRLYGEAPRRIDGHHHMHLCANVLLGRLLPAGTIIRRNFSFQRGEKSFANRFYRKVVDDMLARRHRLVDFFFSLSPVNPPGHVQRILSLARDSSVEVATHPIDRDEYQFLMGREIFRRAEYCSIAPRFF